MGRTTSALLVATDLPGAWRLNTARKQSPARRTAGALLGARTGISMIDSWFFTVDVVLNVDLGRMWAAHAARQADATLFVHPNDHPYNSDIVETDMSDRIVALHPYPHQRGRDLPNLVNAALYVVEKRCVTQSQRSMKLLILRSILFRSSCGMAGMSALTAAANTSRMRGTPDRLSIVIADMASGRVDEGSRRLRLRQSFSIATGT